MNSKALVSLAMISLLLVSTYAAAHVGARWLVWLNAALLVLHLARFTKYLFHRGE